MIDHPSTQADYGDNYWYCEHGYYQHGYPNTANTCTHATFAAEPGLVVAPSLERPLRVYLASSWRNTTYPQVLAALREFGYDVYDFRKNGFSQEEVGWQNLAPSYDELMTIYTQDKVRRQFRADLDALQWCDVVVCVLPCGRSAHLELGWGIGTGRPTVLLWSSGEPDIMHMACTEIVGTVDQLLDSLSKIRQELSA